MDPNKRIAEAQRRIDKQNNMSPQEIMQEAARRFNFTVNYNPSKPSNYPTLLEIKGKDKTVFTYELLKEMRNGRVSPIHPIFEVLHNVRDILLTEAYDKFSEFMAKLSTDKNQLLHPDNVVRQTYENFRKGIPQRWKLIHPDEYIRCIEQYSFYEPHSESYDEYWAPRIVDWVANVKDNIAQFAANSYLFTGPTLERTDTNTKGQNLLALLWYNLTGDEEIPYHPTKSEPDEYSYGYDEPQESRGERKFYKKYIGKFKNYIKTSFGKGAESTETDSPLDGMFNIIAAFDKNYSDFKKMFVTLDRLKNMCHGRGGLGHLIMKGGNAACEKICNTKIYNRWAKQIEFK